MLPQLLVGVFAVATLMCWPSARSHAQDKIARTPASPVVTRESTTTEQTAAAAAR